MKKPLTRSSALDMSILQHTAESTACALKTAQTNLHKAEEAAARAETEYVTAQKALKAGVEQLLTATKVQ